MSQPDSGKFLPRLALTAVAIFGILIIKNIGINKLWFEKVGNYWDAFQEQKDADLTEQQIKDERWGVTYAISKYIRDYFQKNNIKNPVILFEPRGYVKEKNGFEMPEPVVFYNYTGLKSLWMDNTDVKNATYVVYMDKGQLSIQPIKSPEELQQIVKKYKPYIQKL